MFRNATLFCTVYKFTYKLTNLFSFLRTYLHRCTCVWRLTENQLSKSVVNVTVGQHPSHHIYEMPAVGRWLIVQQRLDFNVSFYQPWINYTQGLKPPQVHNRHK